MDRSRWPPLLNTKRGTSFPPLLNDRQPSNQLPHATTTKTSYPQFGSRGNINTLRNNQRFGTTINNSNHSKSATPNNIPPKSSPLLKWFMDWLTDRIFTSYPVWIQSVITAIIGFIAYFLYDYGSDIQTIPRYLFYKTISIILFLISVAFLYLLVTNLNNQKPPTLHNLATNNPYSTTSSNPTTTNKNINPSHPTNQNNLHTAKRRDDLFFTNKSMLNRVSSTVLKSTEPKYDYHSSPNKIQSLHPNKIVTHQNLSNFLTKQKNNTFPNTINEYDSILNRAPSSSFSTTTPSLAAHANLNKTPIGKTFGSMRMTPAVPSRPSAIWNSTLDNTNQGSADIATPESSNMDVTMYSYDNTDAEPFPADFSVIQPSPIAKTQSLAWNVSGFGGFNVRSNMNNNLHNRTINNMNMNNMSTLAQAGTPAKGHIGGTYGGNVGGYNYDGMYNDINLRGDNIGQVLTTQNVLKQVKEEQKKQVINVTTRAPMSPFARKRDVIPKKNKTNSMSNIVFTSMGVKKSHFAACYMEKSIDLYEGLNIDGLIHNWAESMRWWLGQMVKTRNNEIFCNDNDINNIFNLLANKYNLKQQLAEFQTTSQKETFIIENAQQLLNVARAENNPSIMHIVQKRKHLKECIDFICFNYKLHNENSQVTEYVYHRLSTLSSTNNLSLYHWNGGDDIRWRQSMFPADAHLLMTLFCRYMDDAMCPAIKFSEKHYIQISYNAIKKIDKLYKKFKDIAIICVCDTKSHRHSRSKYHKNSGQSRMFQSAQFNDEYKDIMDQDSLPYFFIAFNKKKFEPKIKHFGEFKSKQSNIQKPKHFLYNAINGLNDSFNNYFYDKSNKQEMKEEEFSENDDFFNEKKKKSVHVDSVGTWFPQPGKDNLIHTITLFALFIHRYCDDKLTDIALKDQGCTLLQPILR